MELRTVLVLMSICSLASLETVVYFVREAMTFEEAQRYCRENHTDLATLPGRSDVEQLFQNLTYVEDSAWIGLKRTGGKRWLWALANQSFYGQGELQYRNWAKNQGKDVLEYEDCALMGSDGQFYDIYCFSEVYFICFDGQDSNQPYVFVAELKSWRDAQIYCRRYHTDLVSVRNQDENLQIQRMIPEGLFAYIGLFQDAFVWSDNSTSSFRYWDPAQSDGDCVVQHLQGSRMWDGLMCSSRKPFLCSSLLKKRQIVKIQVRSGQGVADPRLRLSIMVKMKQRLEELGMENDTTLEWMLPPVDGSH